jgi:hypothetical protein
MSRAMPAAATGFPSVRGRRRSGEASSRALGARHWLVVAAPLVAGGLAIVGSLADPAAGKDGRELYAAYANEPGRVEVKALAYHFSYAMWLPIVFALVARVRDRGAWLANIAGLLGLLGVTTMPGFVLADFYDSAIGRQFGAEGAFQVEQLMESMAALPAMAATGAIGFILSLPLAAFAAWRAKLLPWWGVAGAVGGLLAFGAVGATPPGAVLLTVGFGALALALARMRPAGGA